MKKLIHAALIAACASAMLGLTGCSNESEYERCMRESMKNMPELVSKPAIEKAMEKFRAMSAEEQKKALEEIKAKLKK